MPRPAYDFADLAIYAECRRLFRTRELEQAMHQALQALGIVVDVARELAALLGDSFR